MKNVIFILSLLWFSNTLAMEAQPGTEISHTINSSVKSNKVKFSFVRERFSHSTEIDYEGLENHIHYPFKNRELLKDALQPLLPNKIGSSKKKFEHLEFLGDSVLGLIIRERLVFLLPQEKRDSIVKLYEFMTQNKTLADVHFENLHIEHYLPFPEGKKGCEVCNIMESLIGAIYLDNSNNGFKNARKFVMRVLDDHVLETKMQQVSLIKGLSLNSIMLSQQEEIIEKVCSPERLTLESPKTLLNEVLLGLWNDRPTYTTTIKKENEEGYFSATVSGAQIGKKFKGKGETQQIAEEDAARKALNFLAGKEVLEPKEVAANCNRTYKVRLKEYMDAIGCPNWNFVDIAPLDAIKVHLKIKDDIVGEGKGNSSELAKEAAAQQACHHIMTSDFEFSKESVKNYKGLLMEFFQLVPHEDFSFVETDLENAYGYHVKIGDELIGKGEGSSKAKAKEEAAKDAFMFLKTANSEKYNYRPELRLFLLCHGLHDCSFTYCQTFEFQVVKGNEVLSVGMGTSKDKAKEPRRNNIYKPPREFG